MLDVARDTLTTAFSEVDVVMTPTLAGLPPRAGTHKMELGTGVVSAIKGALLETCLANVIGTPVIAIPTAERLEPLPFSLQLMTPRGSDQKLLEIGEEIVNQNGLSNGELG